MTNEQLQNEILKEQLKQLKDMNNHSKKPSFVVYMVLALFLGGLGAHKFYVGKIGQGIIYLLLSATGLSLLLSVIDIIIAITKRNEYK